MPISANKLALKFDGSNLQEGVIDIYDLASTILALGNTVESIATISGFTKHQKIKIDVSALRPGSFEVDIIVNFEEIQNAIAVTATAAAMLAIVPVDYSKKVLDIFYSILKLRKFLKGKKPKDIKIDQTGQNPQVTIYNFNGDNMTISMPTYNAMQDKLVNKYVHDIYKPLNKEDGNVDSIELKIDTTEKSEDKELDELLVVTKEEIEYFEDIGELQSVKDYRVKAIVSRLDSKTGNGFLTIGSKRVSFELNGIHPNHYEEAFVVLAESLKLKFPIYVTGEAILDFESNLKKIKITEIKSEAKLF